MLALLLTAAAHACGGFFCTPSVAPVDQAAEEILFTVDEGAGMVEMHVQIAFEGAAEDFAWVVPVPEEPELFVSSEAFFDELRLATNPVYQAFTTDTEGRCGPVEVSLGCTNEMSLAAGAVPPSAPVDSATVVGTAEVGPFDTTTLRADSTEGLIAWLEANEYELSPGLEPLLEPYVAGNSHFVAMRLLKDADTGDIEPIGLRFPGTQMAIPIQLTAIAAAQDMPVRVYVLADGRAVPESYVHVELNEAAIDWIGGGSNYGEVVAAAVDEAGTQAFVTEFAGPLETGRFASAALQGLIIQKPYLTRMLTRISPEEMSVDPTFVINPALPPVDNLHQAEITRDCTGRDETNTMRLTLDDGRVVELGNDRPGRDPRQRIRDLETVPAMAVHDLSLGEGELLVSFSDEADRALEDHNAMMQERHAGCGCAHGRLPPTVFGGLLLGALAWRRRGR